MTPPPVLGFNNNVRHRGRVFHIQTEDSGVKSPRIVTHLFADGGHIIKTTRTDYARHLGRPGLPDLVRQMMKAQHKAMAIALWAGELDAALESALGPLPLPPVPRPTALDAAPPSLPGGSAPLSANGFRAEDASPASESHVVTKSDPTRPKKATGPALGDQTLDEVILSYLADELDASLK